MEKLTIRQFLLNKTDAEELCIIREDGWITASAWIDHEDLFLRALAPRICEKIVKGHTWGVITIQTGNGGTVDVPCHYIDT